MRVGRYTLANGKKVHESCYESLDFPVLSTLPMIWETPDLGPYLQVSRLESDISRIIAKIVMYFFRLDFLTIKFQII